MSQHHLHHWGVIGLKCGSTLFDIRHDTEQVEEDVVP
jgi:hypothetical protein